MKNTKIPIGIEEIQKIKMTLEEKERILGNVLSSPIQITKPIKSPYSFVSMFQRNQFAYFGVILLLLIVLGGGNMILNYSKNGNNQIARINTGGTNAFPTNTNNFNNIMPTTNGTPKNKNTTSSPSLPSSPLAQNTNNGSVSSSGPTAGIAAPTTMENNNLDNQQYTNIASEAFKKWLENESKTKAPFLDYKINGIKIIAFKKNAEAQDLTRFYGDNTENAFTVSVDYNIKTSSENMLPWMNENTVSQGGWIYNLHLFAVVDKDKSGNYYMEKVLDQNHIPE